MPAQKQIGMGGSIVVGGVTYPVQEWSGKFVSENEEVTDTESAGWAARLAGVKSATISFTAFWGAAASSLASGFPIGVTVAATLYAGPVGYTNRITITGNFIIDSFEIKNAAKNAITFACESSSTGAVTIA